MKLLAQIDEVPTGQDLVAEEFSKNSISVETVLRMLDAT
jgi:hypothetical protein